MVHKLGYEWLIRVDDDSNFPERVLCDLVEEMKSAGATYGFRALNTDAEHVTTALPEAVSYFSVSENILPSFAMDLFGNGQRTIFYNNFFVSNVSFWVGPRVTLWLQLLEDLNGFQKFRWGDAPVHTLTLGLFSNTSSVIEFGFAYEHGRGGNPFRYAAGQFMSSFRHNGCAGVPLPGVRR